MEVMIEKNISCDNMKNGEVCNYLVGRHARIEEGCKLSNDGGKSGSRARNQKINESSEVPERNEESNDVKKDMTDLFRNYKRLLSIPKTFRYLPDCWQCIERISIVICTRRHMDKLQWNTVS